MNVGQRFDGCWGGSGRKKFQRFLFFYLRAVPEGEITHHTANQWQFFMSCTLGKEVVYSWGVKLRIEKYFRFGKWLFVNFDIRERFLFNWIISFRFGLRRGSKMNDWNRSMARGQQNNSEKWLEIISNYWLMQPKCFVCSSEAFWSQMYSNQTQIPGRHRRRVYLPTTHASTKIFIFLFLINKLDRRWKQVEEFSLMSRM